MTFSTYNLKVDNRLSFTPGATAGYVLGINADGSTSWIQGGGAGSGSAGTSGSSGSSGLSGSSGSSGSSGLSGLNGSAGTSGSSGVSATQTLQQTLALGNNPGTYSIEGVDTSGITQYGIVRMPGSSDGNTTDNRLLFLASTQSNFRPNGNLSMFSYSQNPFSGLESIYNTTTIGSFATFGSAKAMFSTGNGYSLIRLNVYDTSMGGSYIGNGLFIDKDGTHLYGITSSILATDANGKIIATASTGGGSGTSGTSGSSGSSGLSGSNGTSGSSGIDGINGSSGTSGSSGLAGTSGSSGVNGATGPSGNGMISATVSTFGLGTASIATIPITAGNLCIIDAFIVGKLSTGLVNQSSEYYAAELIATFGRGLTSSVFQYGNTQISVRNSSPNVSATITFDTSNAIINVRNNATSNNMDWVVNYSVVSK